MKVNIGTWQWMISRVDASEEAYIYCQGDKGGMVLTTGEWLSMLDDMWEMKTPDHKQTTPLADIGQDTD